MSGSVGFLRESRCSAKAQLVPFYPSTRSVRKATRDGVTNVATAQTCRGGQTPRLRPLTREVEAPRPQGSRSGRRCETCGYAGGPDGQRCRKRRESCPRFGPQSRRPRSTTVFLLARRDPEVVAQVSLSLRSPHSPVAARPQATCG